MPSFVKAFLEYSKDFESPSAFWRWSAYVSIASILRDHVYLAAGSKRLYPNIYVLFLAPSGYRKGPPVEDSEKLIKMIANTKVISGRASIQGVLDELARTETNAKSGKMVQGGAAIFYAPELAAGIVKDDAAIAILTDIYDGKNDFTSVLRHSPKFRVDRIVFSSLWASNEDMVKGLFNVQANQGGLLARTVLVVPDEQRPPNSLWTTPEQAKEFEECMKNLAGMLREILGVYTKNNTRDVKDMALTASERARFEYDRWYIPFRKKHMVQGDKGGVAGRIHTTIKKVAIILAADEMSLVIEQRHMEEAINQCISLLPNYNAFLMSGSTPNTEVGAVIVKYLNAADQYKLSRRELLDHLWMDFTGEIIDGMLTTLEGAGVISIAASGSSIAYQLTKRTIERLNGRGEAHAGE